MAVINILTDCFWNEIKTLLLLDNLDNIYLDNQSTLPLWPEVYVEICENLGDFHANPHSVDHIGGWQSDQKIQIAKASIAASIGGEADGVIFTSGATEANNLAMFGLSNYSSDRTRILVSQTEHKCVLEAARAASLRNKMDIQLLPVTAEGRVDPEILRSALDETVSLVSIMVANNEIGSVSDIGLLSQIAHEHGAIFHTDAAQAPLSEPIDQLAEFADLISLSSHKSGGPGGIGALYVRPDLMSDLDPQILGGGQQYGVRSGTLSVPLCVSFAKALQVCRTFRQSADYAKMRSLRDQFVRSLLDLDERFRLNGPPLTRRHVANANICFTSYDARDLLNLWQPDIAASTGAACVSGQVDPSYVLEAIGLNEADARASVRFSVGPFTQSSDLDRAVKIIAASL